MIEQRLQESFRRGIEWTSVIENHARAAEQGTDGDVPQSPSDLVFSQPYKERRAVWKVSHIGELVMDILWSEIIVKQMFFDAVEGEALDRCQLKRIRRQNTLRTPCECTMPLGVPVVPDENITTSGVLNGNCSNSSFDPVPWLRKFSNDVL